MAAGPTTRSNLFVPEICTDAIRTGLAGMRALYGTGVAIINNTLSSQKGGEKVTVPYFDALGEMEDVAENAPLTPQVISQNTEDAIVQRSGLAFELTKWAQYAASEDPYAAAVADMMKAVTRRADRGLIAAAATTSLAHDISGLSGANAKLTYGSAVTAKMLFGDEQDDIALMIVHSKTLEKLLLLTDTSGRALVTDAVNTGLQKFVNIPFAVSDILPVDTTPDAEDPTKWKYTSLILKKNSLAFWFNGKPTTEQVRDPLKDSTVAATNMYWAAHCYKKMPGLSKPGVVKIVHKN
jgi:hypothetical protein